MLLIAALPAPAADGIDLRDCRITAGPGFPGIKARCGILLRPLNPDDAGSPLIDLSVAIVPALSLEPRPDPFVPIAGGPGQASTEFYASQAAAFEEIRRTRDIVLLDQRGTGQSSALECPVDEEMLAGEFSPGETLAATRECLDSLPHDPRYFTTSVAVTDLEALRAELGYDRFNLYGVSYGSRVAQHYARRYPAATRSVILDGVVPPQLALGPGIALEAQRALDAIFARCAESAACHERFPDLPGDFATLQERLAGGRIDVDLENPVTGAPEQVAFGRDELAGAVRLLSYHPSTMALIPLLVHEAARGNLAPLAAQYLSTTGQMADALSIGMHNAVVCTEDVPFIDVGSEGRAALGETYIGPIMLEALETICSAWPAGVRDRGFREPLATDLPVLLLSGDADPVTPPAYAERAAVELGNAAHLIGRNQGHGMAPRGCVPDIMADFVREASPASLDTACLERLFAMPFFLNFSGPAP
ncbi:MAG: alpha/beta hydrolase [Woeseiaceae bacterium]|nr:alpha/beta hydrolase [Woeseiaceae bacterium]